MRGRKVSQQQIARGLGVSQALVSLVLNGKRENISEDTCQRIWRYANEVGYRPKGMQMDNRRAGATNVGFVLRAGLRLHTQSNFFSHVQHGLHVKLLEHGYHSLFLGAEDDLGVRALQQTLKQRHLFGVAILGQVQEKFLKAVKAAQQNIVAISISYPGLCHSVMPNELQAVELLVDHLKGLGHRRFAWIGGDKQLNYNLRRRMALATILQQRGMELSPNYSVEVESGDRLGGWQASEIMLQQIPRRNFPTAWVCGNGLLARGTVNCLTQKGWRVPADVSVVALDATRACEEEHPQITGAHADPEKMGAKAAELLLQSQSPGNESLLDVILQPQLTIRETSAPGK
jgi:LacI family transcriptional regulator